MSALVRDGVGSTRGGCAGRKRGNRLLGSVRIRGRLGSGRQGSARLSDGRVGRGLRAGLGLLTIAIDVLFGATQIEGAKLEGGSLELLAHSTRHADGLLLVQEATLGLSRSAGDRSAFGGFQGSSSITTGRGLVGRLVLSLGGGDGSGGGATSSSTRVP